MSSPVSFQAEPASGTGRNLSLFLATHPALGIVVALITGILIHELSQPGLFFWVLLVGLSGIGWLYFLRHQSNRLSMFCLLLFCLAVGGARLAFFYSLDSPHNITRLLQSEKRLVKLQGRIATPPRIKQRNVAESSPEWMRKPRSTCQLQAEMVIDGGNLIPISGLCWVTVQGELTAIRQHDQVELIGWLSKPQPASNRGEFDFQTYLKRNGMSSVLYVKTPEAVRVLSSQSRFNLSYWSAKIKQRWDKFAQSSLSNQNQPLAAAMLLGTRDDLPQELADEFARTGTMHFLAVSGLHVGILALFLYSLCALFNIPVNKLPWVLLLCIWAYAYLTELRPPVMRASLLFSFMWIGRLIFRQASWLQLLSLTALILLLIKPTQIYNVGAQLSFLAVCGIIWIAPFIRQESQFEREFSTWRQKIFRNSQRLFLLSLGIWLFTAPVTLSQFHMLSPVGLILNVVLMPLMMPVLFVGYLTVILSFISPALASAPAYLFDLMLSLFRGVIQIAGESSWGNRFSNSPDIWWMTGYYCMLILIYYAGYITKSGLPGNQKDLVPPDSRSYLSFSFIARFRWVCLACWISVGLVLALIPFRPGKLSMHVYSVGHGSAVLIEFPNGKRLLYDAGSLDGGIRAANAVESSLFTARKPKIDLVVVSHADIDHFNAIPRILKKVPAGAVYLSSHFLDYRQQAVSQFLEELETSRIPVRLIQQGDELQIDPEVTISVLHPHPQSAKREDNDNSLVLLISYAGRRILLTGDLEPTGQEELRSYRKMKIDILTAPHHGAREANTPDFYDWYQPDYVTVSSGRNSNSSAVPESCTSCRKIFSTAESGEIRFEIQPEGQIRIEPFRSN